MNAFLEFLAVLLCITALGAGVSGIVAVWFAVWLSGNFSKQDVADEQSATMEVKE